MRTPKSIISVLMLVYSLNGVLMADSITYSEIHSTESMRDLVKMARVYFGHQSVGFNILDGITETAPDAGINIIESVQVPDSDAFIVHSEVGENARPDLKLADFAEVMRNGMGQAVDIAFLKFCYIDVDKDTNANNLFDQYVRTIDELKRDFPEVQFVHFTVPLTVIESGPKAFIKKLLGRTLGGAERNLKRQQFNELLRSTYGGIEPVFDIAAIESTKQNGDRQSHQHDGQTYYSLVPQYTDDGGHLNSLGRKIVAENLIVFLSDLLAN